MPKKHGSKDVKSGSGVAVIASATSSQVDQALKDGYCVAKSRGEYYILIETGNSGKTSSGSSSKKK
jgi:hypothetical protein